MNKKVILVTGGGTREDIDEVRFITNVSTGKLAARIGELVIYSGHKLVYIHTETAMLPRDSNKCRTMVCSPYGIGGNIDQFKLELPRYVDITVRSTNDAMEAMEAWAPVADAVVHSMACGDFGFKEASTKLKSNSPDDFIKSMGDRIFVNPKILPKIKKYNPKAFLVGFKFEVGLTTKELIKKALHTAMSSNCDLVVANDKKEMQEQNDHVAHFVWHPKRIISPGAMQMVGKVKIAQEILDLVLNLEGQ